MDGCYLFSLFLLFSTFKTKETKGEIILEVQLYNYTNSHNVFYHSASNQYCCCDLQFLHNSLDCSNSLQNLRCTFAEECDTVFTFCIGTDCDISHPQTGSNINFNVGTDSYSIYPILVFEQIQYPSNSAIDFTITAHDDDSEFIDNFTITFPVTLNNAFTTPVTYYGHQNITSITLGNRMFCGNSYYGPQCRTYCVGRNDETGHYTCDCDGNKLCLDGFTGQNCTELASSQSESQSDTMNCSTHALHVLSTYVTLTSSVTTTVTSTDVISTLSTLLTTTTLTVYSTSKVISTSITNLTSTVTSTIHVILTDISPSTATQYSLCPSIVQLATSGNAISSDYSARTVSCDDWKVATGLITALLLLMSILLVILLVMPIYKWYRRNKADENVINAQQNTSNSGITNPSYNNLVGIKEPIITAARVDELPAYEQLSETETTIDLTENGHYELADSSQYNDYSLLNYESIHTTPQSTSAMQNDDYDYIDSEQ